MMKKALSLLTAFALCCPSLAAFSTNATDTGVISDAASDETEAVSKASISFEDELVLNSGETKEFIYTYSGTDKVEFQDLESGYGIELKNEYEDGKGILTITAANNSFGDYDFWCYLGKPDNNGIVDDVLIKVDVLFHCPICGRFVPHDEVVHGSMRSVCESCYEENGFVSPPTTTVPMPTTTTSATTLWSPTTTVETSDAPTEDPTESTTSYIRSTPLGGISGDLPDEITIHSGETFTLYFNGMYITSVKAESSDSKIVQAEAELTNNSSIIQEGTITIKGGEFNGRKTAEVEFIYNTFVPQDGGSKTIKVTVLGNDMNPSDPNDQSYVTVGRTIVFAGMENWIDMHTFLAMDISLSTDCEYISFKQDKVLDKISYTQMGPTYELICDENAPTCTAKINMEYLSISTNYMVSRSFDVQIISKEDYTKNLANYRTALEYDASPMRIGETRAIRIYDPMTGKCGKLDYWGDNDIFNISYNEGDDVMYVTAIAPGEGEIYASEKNTYFGKYAVIEVLDEQYEENSTTTSTMTAPPQAKTKVIYDDSPMKIGEIRKIEVCNADTGKYLYAISKISSNLKIDSYTQLSNNTLEVKALAPGEAKVLILEDTCSEPAFITFNVLDEKLEEPELIPHIKYEKDYYLIEPGETITVNFDINACEITRVEAGENITFGEVVTSEKDGRKTGSVEITCSADAGEQCVGFWVYYKSLDDSEYYDGNGAEIHIVAEKDKIPEDAVKFAANSDLILAIDDSAVILERAGRFSLEGYDRSQLQGAKAGDRLYGFFFYDKDDPEKTFIYGSTVYTFENTNPIIPTRRGDANCDGAVNLADAVLIMQAASNPDKYGIGLTTGINVIGEVNADVDGSGDITNLDALMIQRYKLKLIDKL